jgi:hypothetical protein
MPLEHDRVLLRVRKLHARRRRRRLVVTLRDFHLQRPFFTINKPSPISYFELKLRKEITNFSAWLVPKE